MQENPLKTRKGGTSGCVETGAFENEAYTDRIF